MNLKQRLLNRCKLIISNTEKLIIQLEEMKLAEDLQAQKNLKQRLFKYLKRNITEKAQKLQEQLLQNKDENISRQLSDQMRSILSYLERFVEKRIKEKQCKNLLNHFEFLLPAAQENLLEELKQLVQLASLANLRPEEIEANPIVIQQAQELQKQQNVAQQSPEFTTSLKTTCAWARKQKANVSVFISYAWASDERPWELWVQLFLQTLKQQLELAGIMVYMDLYDSRYGFNSYQHMGRINDCHYIILIGTESLLDKFHRGVSAVCNELNLIRRRREHDADNRTFSVIPLVLSGNIRTALPAEYERFTVIESFLGGNYVQTIKELLAKLYSVSINLPEFVDAWKISENFIIQPNQPLFPTIQTIEEQSSELEILPSSLIASPSFSYPQNYLEKLKQAYQDKVSSGVRRLFDDEMMSIENYYVNLALIKEEEQKQKESHELHNKEEFKSNDYTESRETAPPKSDEENALFSSSEKFFTVQEPIELKDIIGTTDITDKNKTNRLLVIGRAGIGKSTLCQFIVNQWAQNKLWQNRYQGIFRIPLRNLVNTHYAANREYSLVEIINRECFNKRLTTIEQEQLGAALKDNPEKYLIILDGYDELSTQENDRYLVNQAKQLMLYPEVIVTSRPQYNSDFVADKKLEILGFSEENIERYIDNFFKEEGKPQAEKLKQQLQLQPLLKSLARIPLNLEIICSAWQEEKWEVGVTLTDLYQHLVKWLQCRYLKKYHPKYKDNAQALSNLSVALRKELCKEWLEELEKIAWTMCKSRKIYLKKDELLQEQKDSGKREQLIKKLQQCGLLRLTTDRKFYYFAHRTFQEFFAARYCVVIMHQRGSQGSAEYENFQNFFKANKFNPELQIVWWFSAGLIKNPKLLNLFFSLLAERPRDLTVTNELQLYLNCLEQSGIPENNFYVKRLFSEVDQKITEIFKSIESGYDSTENNSLILLTTISRLPQLARRLNFSKKIMKEMDDTQPVFSYWKPYGFPTCEIARLLLYWDQKYINQVFAEQLCSNNVDFNLLSIINARLSINQIKSLVNSFLEDKQFIFIENIEFVIHFLSRLNQVDLQEIANKLLKQERHFNFLVAAFCILERKNQKTPILNGENDALNKYILKTLMNLNDLSQKIMLFNQLCLVLQEKDIDEIFENLFKTLEKNPIQFALVVNKLSECLIQTKKVKLTELAERKFNELFLKIQKEKIYDGQKEERILNLNTVYVLVIFLKKDDLYLMFFKQLLKMKYDSNNYTDSEKKNIENAFKRLSWQLPSNVADKLASEILSGQITIIPNKDILDVLENFGGKISQQNALILHNKALRLLKSKINLHIAIASNLLGELSCHLDQKSIEALIIELLNFRHNKAQYVRDGIHGAIINIIQNLYLKGNGLTLVLDFLFKQIDSYHFEFLVKLILASGVINNVCLTYSEQLEKITWFDSHLAIQSIDCSQKEIEKFYSIYQHLLDITPLSLPKPLLSETLLMQAAREGDLHKVQSLLDENADTRSVDQEGLMAVNKVIDHPKILAWLIKKHQPIDLLFLENILTELGGYLGDTRNKENECLLDKLVLLLTGVKNIIHKKNDQRKRLLAHLQSFGNSKNISELEGFVGSEFLALHTRNLLELLAKIQLGHYDHELKDLKKVDVVACLKRELLLTVQAHHFDNLSDLADKSKDSTLYDQVVDAIIFALIKLLPEEEIIYHTGYDGHTIYIAFRRLSENKLIVRIDNLGRGIEDNHSWLGNHCKPYIAGIYDFDSIKNNMNFRNYLVEVIRARILLREEALPKIYRKFDQNSATKTYLDTLPAKKPQRVGNCVVRSFFVGAHIRLGKELHQLLRSWESNLLTLALPNEQLDSQLAIAQPSQAALLAQHSAIIAAPSKKSVLVPAANNDFLLQPNFDTPLSTEIQPMEQIELQQAIESSLREANKINVGVTSIASPSQSVPAISFQTTTPDDAWQKQIQTNYKELQAKALTTQTEEDKFLSDDEYPSDDLSSDDETIFDDSASSPSLSSRNF